MSGDKIDDEQRIANALFGHALANPHLVPGLQEAMDEEKGKILAAIVGPTPESSGIIISSGETTVEDLAEAMADRRVPRMTDQDKAETAEDAIIAAREESIRQMRVDEETERRIYGGVLPQHVRRAIKEAGDLPGPPDAPPVANVDSSNPDEGLAFKPVPPAEGGYVIDDEEHAERFDSGRDLTQAELDAATAVVHRAAEERRRKAWPFDQEEPEEDDGKLSFHAAGLPVSERLTPEEIADRLANQPVSHAAKLRAWFENTKNLTHAERYHAALSADASIRDAVLASLVDDNPEEPAHLDRIEAAEQAEDAHLAKIEADLEEADVWTIERMKRVASTAANYRRQHPIWPGEDDLAARFKVPPFIRQQFLEFVDVAERDAKAMSSGLDEENHRADMRKRAPFTAALLDKAAAAQRDHDAYVVRRFNELCREGIPKPDPLRDGTIFSESAADVAEGKAFVEKLLDEAGYVPKAKRPIGPNLEGHLYAEMSPEDVLMEIALKDEDRNVRLEAVKQLGAIACIRRRRENER